jgi:hypothetical protein
MMRVVPELEAGGQRREEVRKRETAAQVGDRENGDRRGARERW